MAVTIRLMRFGKKGFPNYRIVAVDSRKKRNGAYLDRVGFYNPLTKPASIEIDEKKVTYWLEKGASISEGMRKLLGKKINSIKRSFKKD